MLKKDVPEVKFPPYEKIKKIYEEIEIIVFRTGFPNTYGRFIINEDNRRKIVFDLIEDGYSEMNDYTMIRRITKKDYEEICNHAQNCYNDLFLALKNGNDCSWTWEFDKGENK